MQPESRIAAGNTSQGNGKKAASKNKKSALDKSAREFLEELIHTPSPTGAEQRIQKLIRERMRDVVETTEADIHGNLILGVNTEKKRRVMLAGHCDQIGFLVKYINSDGYIYLESLGGVDYGTLLGADVTIHTKNGPVAGIVGRKAIHLQSNQELTQIPPANQIWIDIGASSNDEARKQVQLGDYITLNLRIIELFGQRIAAPGLDNKAGLFVCLETLRRVADEKLDVGVYAVSTVQEEIGSRGAETAAYAVQPEVGIAVDVVNATDDPSSSSPQQQVQCKLGGGPAISSGPGTNPLAGQMLRDAADRLHIGHQPAPSGKAGGNDSQTTQVVRRGIATASVGIPQRNMHTQVEVCDLDDIENSVRVLVEFLKSIREETDFRPIALE